MNAKKREKQITFNQWLGYSRHYLWSKVDMANSKVLERIIPEDRAKVKQYIERKVVINEFRTHLPQLIELGLNERDLDLPVIESMLENIQQTEEDGLNPEDNSLLYSALLLVNPKVAEAYAKILNDKGILVRDNWKRQKSLTVPSFIQGRNTIQARELLDERYEELMSDRWSSLISHTEYIQDKMDKYPKAKEAFQKSRNKAIEELLSFPKTYNKEKAQVLTKLGVITPIAILNEKSIDELRLKQLNKLLLKENFKIVKGKVVVIEKTENKLTLAEQILKENKKNKKIK